MIKMSIIKNIIIKLLLKMIIIKNQMIIKKETETEKLAFIPNWQLSGKGNEIAARIFTVQDLMHLRKYEYK